MVNPQNPENPDSKPGCCAHHLNQCSTLKNPVNPDSNNPAAARANPRWS
jgi:hypothetical protein